MKAEINKEGYVQITAETNEEAYALMYIIKDSTRLPKNKVIYNLRILENDKMQRQI